MTAGTPIMMTLVLDPKILLMDEPFGALDTHTKTRLHASLLEIWEKTRQTIVFVTHDLREAITLSDRVIIMSGRPGRVKASYPRPHPAPPRRHQGEGQRGVPGGLPGDLEDSRRGVCLGPA